MEQINDWDRLLEQEEEESIARQNVINRIKHMDEYESLLDAIKDSYDSEFISSNISEEDVEDILEEYLYDNNKEHLLKKLPIDYSADKLIRGLIYKKKDIDKFKQRFNSYNQQLMLESMNHKEEFNYKLMDEINKKTYLIDEANKKKKTKKDNK